MDKLLTVHSNRWLYGVVRSTSYAIIIPLVYMYVTQLLRTRAVIDFPSGTDSATADSGIVNSHLMISER